MAKKKETSLTCSLENMVIKNAGQLFPPARILFSWLQGYFGRDFFFWINSLTFQEWRFEEQLTSSEIGKIVSLDW